MFSARDATPKVNGSEGAFIAIIVVLAVIVVAACVGIFLLLRYWDPSDAERRRRRHLSIRRRGAPAAHPLPIGLRDPAPAVAGSLSEKLGQMFRGGRLFGSGWQPAPDDDDWASGDEELVQHRPERTSVGSAPAPMRRTIVDPGTFAPPGHASPLDSATPPAVEPYENPFEPRPNPFLKEDTALYPHAVTDSGTHFKEDV
ncbi:hypothetical protein K488DRAFT_83489 [Vararia minispora EC-137]|uniref:Uncharacterized protein n=1 Tax=Vararia minispora EC-137 TaxID=1314806 RepID=A0ACB8QTL2_9AGAM|nr:hypothetical protein K488DRAFT_83489 [Vararia minispora EC-137]